MSVSLGISGAWVVPVGMRMGLEPYVCRKSGSVKEHIEMENGSIWHFF